MQTEPIYGILANYNVDQISQNLEFNDSIQLAWHLLFDDYDDFEQKEFGTHLIYALKKYRSKEWNDDWRNEALLGIACDLTYRYDEKFKALKTAYMQILEKDKALPPGLLISLALCYFAPGDRALPINEAIQLVLKANENKIYLDGAWALSALYSYTDDENNQKKWKNLAENLEKEKVECSPPIYPLFLQNVEIHPKKSP